jgi:hypothetical protein
MTEPRRWLSVRSASVYLDVTVATLYDWASDGTIPGVARICRRNPAGCGRHRVTIRIDKVQLDKWLENKARG